jgi:HPt (histidine-containing phosphotransfer) domain-containing protein
VGSLLIVTREEERENKFMNLQECYEEMQGDYEGVKGRLLTDERIQKYLVKFSNAKDYQMMLEALEKKDYELAFRMAHNLKGVSLNLGLTKLQETSAVLCESLRDGEPKEDITGLVEEVKSTYGDTVGAIRQL